MLAISLIVALSAIAVEGRLRQFHFTLHSASRSPGKSSLLIHSIRGTGRPNLSLDGFSREVYLINGQQPGPLIDVNENDDIQVFVQNDLAVETTMHWHGELHHWVN